MFQLSLQDSFPDEKSLTNPYVLEPINAGDHRLLGETLTSRGDMIDGILYRSSTTSLDEKHAIGRRHDVGALAAFGSAGDAALGVSKAKVHASDLRQCCKGWQRFAAMAIEQRPLAVGVDNKA